MKTIERIFDATTGETKDIERDMTQEEIAHYQMRIAEIEAEKQAKVDADAKKLTVETKLASLGLTIEDFKVLGIV